jgi:hypothetical protein
MVVYRLVGNMAHRYSKKNEGVSSGGTTGGSNGQQPHQLKEEENPNNLVYKKVREKQIEFKFQTDVGLARLKHVAYNVILMYKYPS